MQRGIYRLVVSLCLVTFAFAFFFQMKELISKQNSISEASIAAKSLAERPVVAHHPKLQNVEREVEIKDETPNKVLTFAKGPEKPVKTGFLKGTRDYYDLIIVGAGLSGAVFAEQVNKRFTSRLQRIRLQKKCFLLVLDEYKMYICFNI